MEQNQIITELLSKENTKNLNNLGEIHLLTKHFLLLAEELSEEGVTFLQPLKEHRDAYDHLMRVFSIHLRSDLPENFNEANYIEDNIKKAYGHEYRAFFDTADWLTFICRKFIRESLSPIVAQREYQDKYGNYEEVKNFVNGVPFEIAKYREGKDISNEKMIAEVYDYKKTLDQLLSIYKNVRAM